MTNADILMRTTSLSPLKPELEQGLRVVVMGVCGSGKSTVGQALASALGMDFVEGDTLHPPGNVDTMASGTPLTDADRLGWLHEVARQLADVDSFPFGVVASCSALKLSYRNLLRAAVPGLRFVYLEGSTGLLTERLRSRGLHFMPTSLLQSQLDTLEVPGASENSLTLSISLTVPELVSAAVLALGRTEGDPQ
jgi:gluconokinase